jgi:hypothetical protein
MLSPPRGPTLTLLLVIHRAGQRANCNLSRSARGTARSGTILQLQGGRRVGKVPSAQLISRRASDLSVSLGLRVDRLARRASGSVDGVPP